MKIKKNVSIILVICMLLVCFNSFASTNELKVSVSKDKVNLNEEFYIVIDTSEIEINEFEIFISNSFNLTVSSVADDNETEIEVQEKTTNEIKFKVDKSSASSSKFAVYYLAPSQETNIEFVISLNGMKEIITEEIVENSVQENKTYEPVSLTEKITVSVKKEEVLNKVDNKVTNAVNGIKDNNIQNENIMENMIGNMIPGNDKEQGNKEFSDKELDEMFGSTKKEMQAEMMNMKEKMQAMQDENTTLQKQIQLSQVTYQGSYNNYLKSLTISGIEIKNEFHKTISTYFAEVGEDIENVTVKAVAEDSSAIVTIVGNTDLQTGKNKILIKVTADDDSVRTYRIYVTKN